MYKLIIWDLDGVLWSGAIAEGGVGTVNQQVVDFIKKSESVGIIHSVCSNNRMGKARERLEQLGIWKYFVFPSVEFAPKGPRVKQIIESCQLRECDVLFVDDKVNNTNEALYYCPALNIVNYTKFIDNFKMPAGNSRTKFYNILEAKSLDKNNTNFLQDSDINLIIVDNGDTLLFQDRIIELVNRSNILNYTRTRITDYEFNCRYAVFCYDKYGYYGLIGYFSVLMDDLKDFVLSCRVVNMNIEKRLSQYIKNELLYNINWPYQPIDDSGDYSYIKIHNFVNKKDYIFEQESIDKPNSIAKIYAGCVSPIYWIYSDTNKIEYEVLPHGRDSRHYWFCSDNLYRDMTIANDPQIIIYAAINEFNLETVNWRTQTTEYMTLAVTSFVDKIKSSNRKLLVLLPNQKEIIVPDLIRHLENVWESMIDNKHVFKIEIDKKYSEQYWSYYYSTTKWGNGYQLDRDYMYYLGQQISQFVND